MTESVAVNGLCRSLDKLAKAIKEASNEDRTFNEIHGWHSPALDKNDLSLIADKLSRQIKESVIDSDVDEDYFSMLDHQINQLIERTVPQIFNGENGKLAVAAIISTLSGIWLSLADLSKAKWERFEDPNLMPRSLAKKVRGIAAQIKLIEPNLDDLKQTIEQIKDARETAQTLPADLASLNDARKAVEELRKLAASDVFEIGKDKKSANADAASLKRVLAENEGLMKQLLELQRIGTSTALASAFDIRAKELSKSVVGWGWVLFFALSCGVVIGLFRVNEIHEAMKVSVINWEGVWINVLMTIFSVSAPVWLGWVATSQIKQRFRLAEDYAYKSSISNAYEGYRREAVALDVTFRDKLFGSALTRLDELPGRLVDKESHGSPLHELLASQTLRDAVNAIPNFGKNLVDFAETNLAAFRKKSDKSEESASFKSKTESAE